MKKNIFALIGICILVSASILLLRHTPTQNKLNSLPTPSIVPLHPLSIVAMRERVYPGSQLTIEQQLSDGSNYHQYLTSYKSDGLKILALLTVPMGDKPKNGWPVILFNHGYIDPAQYQTFPSVGQYASYYPYFSREGYIVFKPDYRGNGSSEGNPEGAYYSPAYATDDLNALTTIQNYKDADPKNIGVWGHSMGGNITLRDLVVNTKDIKVAVIWGGVVGSYEDLFFNWQRKVPFVPGPRELALRNNLRQKLTKQYGDPRQNPTFWNTLDPTKFLGDITTPIQIDVGGEDEEVPAVWSENLYQNLKKSGKTVEYFVYPGDNHNISSHLSEAMQRSLNFFNTYLKKM